PGVKLSYTYCRLCSKSANKEIYYKTLEYRGALFEGISSSLIRKAAFLTAGLNEQDSNDKVFANIPCTCPVSGDNSTQKFTLEYKWKIYAFCGKTCRSIFKLNPQRYINKSKNSGCGKKENQKDATHSNGTAGCGDDDSKENKKSGCCEQTDPDNRDKKEKSSCCESYF
ncbi:MAG: YHS domain-containing protein, partial [Planctomycetes bacterium]|nr:YHS domain-containing protein [Planctomycetota bacterium]